MFIAHVNFTKEVQKDNWFNGCELERWITCDEDFTVEFENTEDLIRKLADYVTMHFDVYDNDFISFVNNECENNRFDYNQNEDQDGIQVNLTELEPDGYLADYFFHIVKVTKEIDYTFDCKKVDYSPTQGGSK